MISSLALFLLVQSEARLFVGTDAGFSYLKSDVKTEANKTGFQWDGKALGSLSTGSFVGDLGLGFAFNRMTGTKSGVKDNITTRFIFLEASPRYAVTESWQIGASLQSGFGTDLNFSTTGGKKLNIAFFAGPQIVYQRAINDWLLRIGTQLLTDLNVENRQVYMILGGLQLGFPPRIFESSSNTRVLYEGTQKAPKKSEPSIELVSGPEFESNSTNISKAGKAYLHQVARFLMEHDNEWKALLISGHADKVGSYEYNRRLSMKRAESAKAELVAGGIVPSRIQAEGRSFSEPIRNEVSPEANRINRRVELSFPGSRRAEWLLQEIKSLQKR